MAAFGNRLRKAREKREISQIELAEALGVSQGTISQWEGNIRRPNDEQIKLLKEKLGDALKVKTPSSGQLTKKETKQVFAPGRQPDKTHSARERKQPRTGSEPATAKTRNGKIKDNMSNKGNGEKSLESWIWYAACSIRGAQDAPKYKDFILPLVFTKLR